MYYRHINCRIFGNFSDPECPRLLVMGIWIYYLFESILVELRVFGNSVFCFHIPKARKEDVCKVDSEYETTDCAPACQ